MEPDAARSGLYPVFKEHGWRGRSFVPHVPFLSIPDHPMPVIA